MEIKPSWQPLTSPGSLSFFLSSEWAIVYNHRSSKESLLNSLILYCSALTPTKVSRIYFCLMAQRMILAAQSFYIFSTILSYSSFGADTEKNFLYMGHDKLGGTHRKRISTIYFFKPDISFIWDTLYSLRVSIIQILSSIAH